MTAALLGVALGALAVLWAARFLAVVFAGALARGALFEICLAGTAFFVAFFPEMAFFAAFFAGEAFLVAAFAVEAFFGEEREGAAFLAVGDFFWAIGE
ncbi:MAG: hypothetical protein ACRD1T_26940 [Acidimicrobiia bacterium]